MLDQNDLIEISICTDCMFYIANGEVPEPNPLFDEWDIEIVQKNFSDIEGLCVGITTDNCEHDFDDQESYEAHVENCEHRGFMGWSQCSGCETWLAGDRFWANGFLNRKEK